MPYPCYNTFCMWYKSESETNDRSGPAIWCRDVQANALRDVAAGAEAVKARGFVNYFGLQRFGTGPIKTHRCAFSLTSQCCQVVCQIRSVVLLLWLHEGSGLLGVGAWKSALSPSLAMRDL